MSLPLMMNQISAEPAGGPDVLHLVQGERPQPRADEILIRVQAAGVNRPDVQQRKGLYPPPPGASKLLGLEAAGEVAALGADVTGWTIGAPVTALCNGGAYAEYVTAPASQCLPWPAGFSAVQAAALPETYFTVWANLFDMGHLRPGESVLIHGGSSGIGVTAIQLATALGARAYATAGSAEKCAACEKLGAAAAINYRTADFVTEIELLTDKKGVDVVLDMVGAPYTPGNLKILARDGRLVQIAFLNGSKVDNLDLLPVMLKRLTITGSTMRPRTSTEKAAIAQALHKTVWPLLEAGRCLPVISAVFPLAHAAQAHHLMESSAHIGKIMLRMD
ncbi:MAG: NAD(P)H-quinone oxidoreductase [Rhodospirillales bacterium 20-60-12]|nr:MAG: NAD(P)H-quinone oxidoreductase [Rhodospirillales bacterium 20-60-12]HQT66451.1 NAD(P)H-quinone oxidoreductase [Acetobacteraceae bacterium]HQU01043.1 NAD(P)H-quinone oxidoreductase [Acetobacteraceae bacterium]